MKKPYCHPNLPYYAKGMCRKCYERNLRERNPDFAQRQRENTANWIKTHKQQKKRIDSKYHSRPDVKERKNLRKRKKTFASFGLSLDNGYKLLEIQKYRCAICGKPAQQENHKRFLELDHDHENNEPRGFLCQKCNKGLGLLGDNKKGIERALKYLKSPPINSLEK